VDAVARRDRDRDRDQRERAMGSETPDSQSGSQP
jgi:hypothetical protein